MKTCVDCKYLKDVGAEWLCMQLMEHTVNPENYNAEECEYYKEIK